MCATDRHKGCCTKASPYQDEKAPAVRGIVWVRRSTQSSKQTTGETVKGNCNKILYKESFGFVVTTFW